MTISRRAFLRGFSATAGIAALAGCDLLGQLDPADGEGIGIIAPARITDQPDPNSTPTAEPDTWQMGAPMPTPRAMVAGAAVQGWIYVMGGLREGGASDDNEAYDPFTDRWQEAAPLPQPLLNAAAVGADGAIYVVGGFDQEVRPSPDSWRYDPSTDSWEQLRPMPTPRGGLGAAFVDGMIYAVGGSAGPIDELPTLEAYDISNDRWESLAAHADSASVLRGWRRAKQDCDSWR